MVQSWSKKRLFLALATLLFLGGVGYFALVNVSEKAKGVLGEEIKGKQTEEVRLPTRDDVDKILENVRSQLSTITSENITASEAAVQKAIADLQSIQGGSQSAIGAFCDLVCKK